MKMIKLGLLVLAWWLCLPLVAQDKLPPHPAPQDTMPLLTLHAYHAPKPMYGPVQIGNALPSTFRNTCANRLLHSEHLAPFFAKLCQGTEPVRVVQLGDSHVRGHVFPVAARRTLEQAFGAQAVYPDSITYQTDALAHETGAPGIVYHAIGINGATTEHFCDTEKMETIAALRPDLIILSFGTNESFTRRYDPVEHFTQMDALLTLIRHYNPDATVMVTTPPGCYVRAARRRKVINPRGETAAQTILKFAEQRQLTAWDLYKLAGGQQNACLNWKNHRYMQRDQVHYTAKGYTLQGTLLAEAILQAFNDYVAN